jgi:uracil-DNA glycosylase family 4
MSHPVLEDADSLRQQLLTHLRCLRGAGVEWLPLGPPRDFAAAIAPPETLVAPPTILLDISEAPSLSAVSGLSLEQRRLALQTLADEVKTCTRCPELCSTRTQTVFAQGEPGVELCFIGEAPGAEEDAQGLPFVGPAGQKLNSIITGCGLKRGEIYICNIIKCRPPGNRTPLPSETANCRDYLEKQLELVNPKYIVALGGCAATNLLNTTLALGKLRGRFHDYRGIPVLVTYHPSYLLPHRHPEKRVEVWEDMKMLLTKMGRPIPGKRT